MWTHAPFTVMGSFGLRTRRSMSAALPSPASAAFSRRRNPACLDVPVGAPSPCMLSKVRALSAAFETNRPVASSLFGLFNPPSLRRVSRSNASSASNYRIMLPALSGLRTMVKCGFPKSASPRQRAAEYKALKQVSRPYLASRPHPDWDACATTPPATQARAL